MIVCPNCDRQNPDGAVQCENCYTPLPTTTSCPNCGTTVQADASFCGQCGFNLQQQMSVPAMNEETNNPAEPIAASIVGEEETPELSGETSAPDLGVPPDISLEKEPLATPVPPASASSGSAATTQLQVEQASLLHIQTNQQLELPQHLTVIHLGKPGGAIPPDIDVSGFPDSAVVSRVHADIRVEGGIYYLEDVGSSNGTYVNHTPLPIGNRHRLRAGDRIALGKEDKVSFIFQLS